MIVKVKDGFVFDSEDLLTAALLQKTFTKGIVPLSLRRAGESEKAAGRRKKEILTHIRNYPAQARTCRKEIKRNWLASQKKIYHIDLTRPVQLV